MKNVIIVDKINHIIIESREEEVADVGGKWDTFLEVDAFRVALHHPDSFFCVVFVFSKWWDRSSASSAIGDVIDWLSGRKLQISGAELLPGCGRKAGGCETSLLCPPVAAAEKHPLSSVSNWSHLLLLFHNELSSQVLNTKRGFCSFCLQHMQLVHISCSHCKSFLYIIGQCKYRQIMQWYHLLKLLCLRFRIIGVPQI